MSILRTLLRRPAPPAPPVLSKADARQWLRAGRPCTLREWSALDADTRESLEVAGLEHLAEVATLFAVALGGPEGMAMVSRMGDAGEAADVAGIDAALERALGRRGQAP